VVGENEEETLWSYLGAQVCRP